MSGIRHLVEASLYVDDLERADAFYGGVLGLERVAREEGRSAFYRAGESMLLVFLAEATLRGDSLPPHGAHGPGHVALGIAAEDLETWRARLESEGFPIEHEQSWPRGGRSLYVRDTAGNLLELVTPGLWGLPSGW